MNHGETRKNVIRTNAWNGGGLNQELRIVAAEIQDDQNKELNRINCCTLNDDPNDTYETVRRSRVYDTRFLGGAVLQIDFQDDEARRQEILGKCDRVNASENTHAHLGGEGQRVVDLIPHH